MKNLSLKKVAAVVLVLVLGLVAGDLTLRDESSVQAIVGEVKTKVESLLEDEAEVETESAVSAESAQ